MYVHTENKLYQTMKNAPLFTKLPIILLVYGVYTLSNFKLQSLDLSYLRKPVSSSRIFTSNRRESCSM